jgi:hypothetical protein
MINWEKMLSMTPLEITLVVTLLFWTIVWKGIALWIAAQENRKVWFIAILILNTFGIVELIFIFFLSKKGKQVKAQSIEIPIPGMDEHKSEETPTDELIPPEETKEEKPSAQ